jgi:nucleoside-diphosphate-sugar epimerase
VNNPHNQEVLGVKMKEIYELFPPSLMRFAGRLFGKGDAVERLVSSLTIDSSKIRRELGWKPPYTMEQGLRETGEWFKKHGHAKPRR